MKTDDCATTRNAKRSLRWVRRSLVTMTAALLITLGFSWASALTVDRVGGVVGVMGGIPYGTNIVGPDGTTIYAHGTEYRESRYEPLVGFIGSPAFPNPVNPAIPYQQRAMWSPPTEYLPKDALSFGIITLGYGWPMPALACDHLQLSVGTQQDYTYHEKPLNGIEIDNQIQYGFYGHKVPRTLPTRIIPIGFAINWLIACGVVGLVHFVVSGYLRFRREQSRRRWANGICPWCKYEVADLPRCPECGRTGERRRHVSHGAVLCVLASVLITGALWFYLSTHWCRELLTYTPHGYLILTAAVVGVALLSAIGIALWIRFVPSDHPRTSRRYLFDAARAWSAIMAFVITLVVVLAALTGQLW